MSFRKLPFLRSMCAEIPGDWHPLGVDGQARRERQARGGKAGTLPSPLEQSVAPIHTNPIRSVCTKPLQALPCREGFCLCVGQALLYSHHEQTGKKSAVQPTVPPCVIKTWFQTILVCTIGSSCQAKGWLQRCRGAGISSRKGWKQQCGVKAFLHLAMEE